MRRLSPGGGPVTALAEAETLLRDSVATYRKAFAGNDNPDITRSLGNLAFVLQKEGDLAKAEATQREALAMQTRLFGARHPFVAESTLDLALLLQKEGRLAEAEKLFNDVLTPEVAGQPWTSHLLYSRGILHARLGRWEEASTDLARALKCNPDNPDDHWIWFKLAPLLVERDDRPGYRQYCQAMLARFGKTTDPFIADKTAKACLLSPSGGTDLTATERLTDLAVKAGSNLPALPWFQFGKALAEYRQDRLAGAVEWAQKALDNPLDK